MRTTDGGLLDGYRAVRDHTEALAAPLSAEDQCVQSMPDASPAKWHRAHTTWFFEQFLLTPHLPGYAPCDPDFAYLFNSYYEQVGARHPRPARGLITRPSADAVTAYRAHVDAAMARLLARPVPDGLAGLVRLGLQHEQQHQELLATDILHAFAQSPLAPASMPGWREPAGAPGPTRMIAVEGGVRMIGHDGERFAFDNEMPRHEALLAPFRIADRLVRNAEWLDFIADGGYASATLWMADGFDAARAGGWSSPLHWRGDAAAGWSQMGAGRRRAAEPGRAGAACELVRGGRLRPLVRPPPADRGGVGGRRRRPAARRGHRPRLAVDRERLSPLPRLPPAAGRDRRIQRQIHDQHDGAAWRLARHAAGPHAPDLPQLLPSRPPLAIHRRPSRRGFFLVLDGLEPFPDVVADALAGLLATPKTLPPKLLYDAEAAGCSVRSPGCPNIM